MGYSSLFQGPLRSKQAMPPHWKMGKSQLESLLWSAAVVTHTCDSWLRNYSGSLGPLSYTEKSKYCFYSTHPASQQPGRPLWCTLRREKPSTFVRMDLRASADCRSIAALCFRPPGCLERSRDTLCNQLAAATLPEMSVG